VIQPPIISADLLITAGQEGETTPVNEAQQQLANQSARNLADEAALARPTPTEEEVSDGQYAYAAYGAPSGAGNRTWDGRMMPAWDQLGDQQRAGWIAVGRAFAARAAAK
jgi:hypothetical protein